MTNTLPDRRNVSREAITNMPDDEQHSRIAALATFLPAPSDPDYLFVLGELVREDCDARIAAGEDASWNDYSEQFPVLARLKLCGEQHANADSDAVLDLTRTPVPSGRMESLRTESFSIRAVASSELDTPRASSAPQLGDDFFGFELLEELGRGAFGKVYLARERKLAGRPVALKLTSKPSNESLRLAQLQHTNIVPIQNAFHAGQFHVVQMPFCGRQTLHDLINYIKTKTTFPAVAGDVFHSTLSQLSSSRTLRANPSSRTNSSSTAESDTYRALSPADPVEQLAATETKYTELLRSPLVELLGSMDYPHAVVQIMTWLADGLAHAHTRGILHLDLKPQNILFSEEGQPMLLDFNLSFDTKSIDRERVGGTWPYMAPELIREFADLPNTGVDERTDLYALGVIFFELLTCQLPFAPIRNWQLELQSAIDDRMDGPPNIHALNPSVTPALEAMVRKLLAGDPAKRYLSADELRIDLKLYREHRPLRYAGNPSVRERCQQWQHRNPRTILQIVAFVAMGLFSGASLVLWTNYQERAVTQSRTVSQTFENKLAEWSIDLVNPVDVGYRAKSREEAIVWINQFSASSRDGQQSFENLPPVERQEFRNTLGETALLLAHSYWLDGETYDPKHQVAHFAAAAKWNEVALQWYRDAPITAVWKQRQQIATRLKDETLIATIPKQLPETKTATDLYYQAAREVAAKDYEQASKTLNTLLEDHPNHFAGQSTLGSVYFAMGQHRTALERYQIAKVLRRNDPRVSYYRGLTFMVLRNYSAADVEFTTVIELTADRQSPLLALAYWQRGLVARQFNDLPTALTLVNQAIDAKGPLLSLYTLRADLHKQLGKDIEAQADYQLADHLPVRTANDLCVQAIGCLDRDIDHAIALLHRAIELDTNSLAAWRNLAHATVDRKHQTKEGLKYMVKCVEISPQNSDVKADYAVMLARVGQREAAHQQIQKALLIGQEPILIYKAACVYALTSREEPDDLQDAMYHLQLALRLGFRDLKIIATDNDLDPIRSTQAFKDLLRSVRLLTE